MSHKALFLDRDGIINEDSAYPYKPEQIVFTDGIFDLCHKAILKGYLIIVVTNQAGVAKGYFTEDDVLALHQWIKERFSAQGIEITAFYFSPYHPAATVERYRKDTECRKPGGGMIRKAVEDFDIDLSKSLMVGDKLSDRIKILELQSVIMKSKYVQCGYDIENLASVEKYLSNN
jgi:D-glycero-D-manno-heptose 1,7-bisphosphate phosphatase